MSSRPPGASSWAQPCSSREGMPPMPILPSASSTVAQRPCPSSGSNTDGCRADAPAWRPAPPGHLERQRAAVPGAGDQRGLAREVGCHGGLPYGQRCWLDGTESAAPVRILAALDLLLFCGERAAASYRLPRCPRKCGPWAGLADFQVRRRGGATHIQQTVLSWTVFSDREGEPSCPCSIPVTRF